MLLHDGPLRPSLIDMLEDDTGTITLLPDFLRGPPSFSSVNWVFTCPRVLGFHGDGCSYARINLTGMMTSESPGSLIDGGANISVTGNLDLLFDAIEITPLPISVTLQGEITQDDCFTACGKIPFQLDDGLIYWQDCYYSKNAVEIIISPQAIVDSSDVFQSWHQTGYRNGDSTLGSIRFDSYDGFLSMTMTLVHHEGLHYCPTDAYTVNYMPATRYSPALNQIALAGGAGPAKGPTCSRFVPTTKAKQVELEVWLLCFELPGVHQLDLLLGHVTGIPLDFRYHPFHFIDHKE
jgi:hypothetical protein